MLRFRGTLAGQKCVSRRGGFAQLGDTKARSPGREIVRGGSRKVGLLVVGRSRRPAQSTQHHRIALAMSHCLGTSCRIRVRNSPSRSLPEPKICLRAAAPQAAFAACSVAAWSRDHVVAACRLFGTASAINPPCMAASEVHPEARQRSPKVALSRVGVRFSEGRDFYRFTPFCTEGNFYRFMPNSDAHFYRFTHSPGSAEIRM